jgi:hypothetical protein
MENLSGLVYLRAARKIVTDARTATYVFAIRSSGLSAAFSRGRAGKETKDESGGALIRLVVVDNRIARLGMLGFVLPEDDLIFGRLSVGGFRRQRQILLHVHHGASIALQFARD